MPSNRGFLSIQIPECYVGVTVTVPKEILNKIITHLTKCCTGLPYISKPTAAGALNLAVGAGVAV